MVSYLPSCLAISVFVPTPSVEVARSGRLNFLSALTSNNPAKPPMSPTTSGRRAFLNVLSLIARRDRQHRYLLRLGYKYLSFEAIHNF